jgi:hypothetical protein
MIRKLKKSDINNLYLFLNEKDKSITNTEVLRLVKDCVNSKKYSLVVENNEAISGFLVIEKQDDKNYLSIISDNKETSNHLLQVLFWDFKSSIYANIEKSNKLGFLLKKYKFKIIDKTDAGYVLYYDPKWKDNKYGSRNRNNHK